LIAPQIPSEATALLALMLLHDSRRDSRLDEAGDLVLLEDQDRSRWHHDQIREALPLVAEALQTGAGRYAIQAAIAAEHCRAAHAEDTDWRRIADLYSLLERVDPSPVVSLNRAVAIAMSEGPAEALALIDAIADDGALDRYHLLHAARADMLRRLNAYKEAAESYSRALELATNESERRFLERRLRELEG
jgi:RNA polymerase sigma-70 factor (ECF subfamily)